VREKKQICQLTVRNFSRLKHFTVFTGQEILTGSWHQKRFRMCVFASCVTVLITVTDLWAMFFLTYSSSPSGDHYASVMPFKQFISPNNR